MTNPNLDSVLAARLDELERDARSEAKVLDMSVRSRVRRRRAAARGGVAAMVTVGIAVVSLGTATAVTRSLDGSTEPIAPPSLEPPAESPLAEGASTMLIVVTDTNVSNETAVFETRLDTLALIHVPADGSRIEVVSIPRDVAVAVPSGECDLAGAEATQTPAGLSAVFEHAALSTDVLSAAMCIQRILEQESGIGFTGMIVTDFAGFISGVDVLGGAAVCLPAGIDAPEAGLSLTSGEHHLAGIDLLMLARVRAGTGLADGTTAARSERSAEVLAAIVRATLAQASTERYSSFTTMVDSALKNAYVTSSRGSDPASGELAWALGDLLPGDVVPFALPVDIDAESGETWWAPGAHDAFTRIQRDEPLVAEPWPAC